MDGISGELERERLAIEDQKRKIEQLVEENLHITKVGLFFFASPSAMARSSSDFYGSTQLG